MDSERRKAIHAAMVRLAEGDRSAFDPLIDALWPVILAFAQRAVGRGADAEDVAQEVFFRICSRIADFDRTRDALSWAFGIASYEVMTHRKRIQRRREVHDGSALAREPDRVASPEQRLFDAEIAGALDEALAALSAPDRAALGLGGPESTARVSAPALRKRRQRALARLRLIWRTRHGEP